MQSPASLRAPSASPASAKSLALAASRAGRAVRWRERGFLVAALAPPFFFLICFYVYPTIFNIENSLTDLSLFGLRRGGDWVGIENYAELLNSADFRRVLWNTVVWLTVVGVSVRILLGLALAFLLNSATLRRRPNRLRSVRLFSMLKMVG